MLCKQIDWFKRQRPDVKAVVFHWHAWGDVGMATKPETRLALEMIDMQFMPAREGMEHLIAELESDSSATEVLITDDRYYRAFYPAETLVANDLRGSGQRTGTPMLVEQTGSGKAGVREFVAKVDPSRDPFLTDHKLDGNPLLPFVIASEILMEAAAACCGSNEKVVLQDIEAIQGLRFFSSGARELSVYCDTSGRGAGGSGAMQLGLQCDFLSRDGRLVEANRLHFRAKASVAGRHADRVRLAAADHAQWVRAIYPPIGEKFYVGWPFQRLRKVTLTDDGLIGKIAAPALIELAGTGRDLRGWQIPCAAMDSCLFAVGALAWQRVAPGTALPIRIGRLEVGRLPSPGEACEVHVRLLSHGNDRACFDFTLYGVDGDVLLNACDYEVAWLQAASASDAGAACRSRLDPVERLTHYEKRNCVQSMFVSTSRLPHLLQPSRYVDEAALRDEVEGALRSSWHVVGTTQELSRPGDFLTTNLFGTPVQVRNFGGTLSALSNVCAHRHALITSKCSGNSKTMQCQYHGWEYQSDGNTGRIPQPKNFVPFDEPRPCLPRYALETVGQLVFVSLASNPKPIREFLGEDFHQLLCERFSDRWSLALRWNPEYSVNWKIPIENSLEAYHVPNVHPKRFAKIQAIRNRSTCCCRIERRLERPCPSAPTVSSMQPFSDSTAASCDCSVMRQRNATGNIMFFRICYSLSPTRSACVTASFPRGRRHAQPRCGSSGDFRSLAAVCAISLGVFGLS